MENTPLLKGVFSNLGLSDTVWRIFLQFLSFSIQVLDMRKIENLCESGEFFSLGGAYLENLGPYYSTWPVGFWGGGPRRSKS